MTALLVSRDWLPLAACRRADPEIFFPVADAGTPAGHEQVMLALSFCAGCPVRPECLDDALAAGVEHGVWGGTTETERETARCHSSREAA